MYLRVKDISFFPQKLTAYILTIILLIISDDYLKIVFLIKEYYRVDFFLDDFFLRIFLI